MTFWKTVFAVAFGILLAGLIATICTLLFVAIGFASLFSGGSDGTSNSMSQFAIRQPA